MSEESIDRVDEDKSAVEEDVEAALEEEEVGEETIEVEEREEAKIYPDLPEDVEVIEERIYTVPLWKAVRRCKGLHRAKRGVNFLKRFVSRHMKSPIVKISPEVNKMIWARGIRNPPRRIKVRVVRTREEEVWVLKY
jgi:ribosomal protein L31E